MYSSGQIEDKYNWISSGSGGEGKGFYERLNLMVPCEMSSVLCKE